MKIDRLFSWGNRGLVTVSPALGTPPFVAEDSFDPNRDP